jgi:hypothetical protein
MSRHVEDEFPTRRDLRRVEAPKRNTNVDDLAEIVGGIISDQIALRKEQDQLRKLFKRKSLAPPPLINKGNLAIITISASAIVTAVVTTLRQLGVMK